eukprot:CAMPEP_0171459286 /NCGR_PEP_ID=MMETSP0945-20130129/4630_1 /TAXON_ID=109269 /ORGANISM="Vaucheria litorea, Strain CCMP2940" /LENGTH=149 /DNA_ID=CAMNT_0011985273 /DNA_START=27 /DNA_END=476 /DNA_ORIENTATION=-
MAEALTEEQIAECRDAFSIFDKDGNGTISTSEIAQVMRSMNQNPSEEEIQQMISEVDSDGSGNIDFDEFLRMMAKSMNEERNADEEMLAAFQVFDRDGNGLISIDELKQVMIELDQQLTNTQLEELVKQADVNGDGQINYLEFAKMMKG